MNKYIRYFLRRNKIYRGNLKSTYKNWNVLPCDELYLNKISNKQRIEHCALMTEKIIFHTYWHGDFGLKQSFSIKSFLCTQDLRNTELWLWLDASNGYSQLLENKYLLELKDKIKILPWNIEEEIFDTPFQNIKSFLLKDKPLPARGDDFRIIALYKFGGVYFDLDIMFLKDFSSLLRGHEFVYAWEYQPYANSAVIYLRKNSFLTIYLMKKMRKEKRLCRGFCLTIKITNWLICGIIHVHISIHYGVDIQKICLLIISTIFSKDSILILSEIQGLNLIKTFSLLHLLIIGTIDGIWKSIRILILEYSMQNIINYCYCNS